MNNDAEQFEFGNYLASRLQLRELAESIKSRDGDYASDLLTLFENQKLDRLREDNERSEETRRMIEQHNINVERNSDD